jgi:hypothetical protein
MAVRLFDAERASACSPPVPFLLTPVAGPLQQGARAVSEETRSWRATLIDALGVTALLSLTRSGFLVAFLAALVVGADQSLAIGRDYLFAVCKALAMLTALEVVVTPLVVALLMWLMPVPRCHREVT